jgi:hypothetical protein
MPAALQVMSTTGYSIENPNDPRRAFNPTRLRYRRGPHAPSRVSPAGKLSTGLGNTTYTQHTLTRTAAIIGRSPIRGGSRSDDGNIRRSRLAPAAAHHAAPNGGELTPGVRVVIEQGYRSVRAPQPRGNPGIVFPRREPPTWRRR